MFCSKMSKETFGSIIVLAQTFNVRIRLSISLSRLPLFSLPLNITYDHEAILRVSETNGRHPRVMGMARVNFAFLGFLHI